LLRAQWPLSRSSPNAVVMGPGFRQDDGCDEIGPFVCILHPATSS
jgi:hypothetical protein